RRDEKTRARHMRLETPRDRDLVRRETDLLMRLAQRRIDDGLAGRFDAPSGEADLARMVLEVRGTFREQDVESRRTFDERDQHGRLPALGVERREAVRGDLRRGACQKE